MTKLEINALDWMKNLFTKTERGFAKIYITRVDGKTVKIEMYLSETEDRKKG